MRPANTLRLTIASVSSLRWKSSSKRSAAGRTESARARGSLPSRESSMPMSASSGLALAFGEPAEDLLDHVVRLHTVGLALEVQEHPVTERRKRRRLHVVDGSRESPFDDRADLGREEHRLEIGRAHV